MPFSVIIHNSHVTWAGVVAAGLQSVKGWKAPCCVRFTRAVGQKRHVHTRHAPRFSVRAGFGAWYLPGMSTPLAPFGSAAALRRMIEGHERAAREARRTERVLEPEAAFDASMDLWSLVPELLHAPADAVRLREVEQTRAAWKKLKARTHP